MISSIKRALILSVVSLIFVFVSSTYSAPLPIPDEISTTRQIRGTFTVLWDPLDRPDLVRLNPTNPNYMPAKDTTVTFRIFQAGSNTASDLITTVTDNSGRAFLDHPIPDGPGQVVVTLYRAVHMGVYGLDDEFIVPIPDGTDSVDFGKAHDLSLRLKTGVRRTSKDVDTDNCAVTSFESSNH